MVRLTVSPPLSPDCARGEILPISFLDFFSTYFSLLERRWQHGFARGGLQPFGPAA
jgi:hypothetical protein